MATNPNLTRWELLNNMVRLGCWKSEMSAEHYLDPNLFNEGFVQACREVANMNMTIQERIAYCDERFPFIMRGARRTAVNGDDDDDDDDDECGPSHSNGVFVGVLRNNLLIKRF